MIPPAVAGGIFFTYIYCLNKKTNQIMRKIYFLPAALIVGMVACNNAGDKTTTTPDPSTESDAMKSMTRWPVTVSYFDREAKTREGEQTPVYAMSFELYENGVSRALVLDYNDFVIAGSMGKFDVKDSKPCK